MPTHDLITVDDTDWVPLTTDSVTACTFAVLDRPVWIAGTVDAVAPVDLTVCMLPYAPGKGEVNRPLSELFPGIAATRLWVRAQGHGTRVSVSHA